MPSFYPILYPHSSQGTASHQHIPTHKAGKTLTNSAVQTVIGKCMWDLVHFTVNYCISTQTTATMDMLGVKHAFAQS